MANPSIRLSKLTDKEYKLLEICAERNTRTVAAEVCHAIREHLMTSFPDRFLIQVLERRLSTAAFQGLKKAAENSGKEVDLLAVSQLEEEFKSALGQKLLPFGE